MHVYNATIVDVGPVLDQVSCWRRRMAISKFLAEHKLSLKFAHVYHAEIMGSGEANCPQADWGAFLPAHSLQVRTVHLKNDE